MFLIKSFKYRILDASPCLFFILRIYFYFCRHSSVGVATSYGVDVPEVESRWGRDFAHPSRPALWSTQPPIQWVQGLSRGSSDRGVALTSHPHLAPILKVQQNYTSFTPSGFSWLFLGWNLSMYISDFWDRKSKPLAKSWSRLKEKLRNTGIGQYQRPFCMKTSLRSCVS